MSAFVGMIRDQTQFDAYTDGARAAREGHPLTPVVGYGPIETLEGQPVDGILINQFPSSEAALAWYESPAYQAALPHRVADYRVLVVPGVDGPPSS